MVGRMNRAMGLCGMGPSGMKLRGRRSAEGYPRKGIRGRVSAEGCPRNGSRGRVSAERNPRKGIRGKGSGEQEPWRNGIRRRGFAERDPGSRGSAEREPWNGIRGTTVKSYYIQKISVYLSSRAVFFQKIQSNSRDVSIVPVQLSNLLRIFNT